MMKERKRCIGIRKPHKPFEKRVPLTPAHIQKLAQHHPDLHFLIEKSNNDKNPENERAYRDEVYQRLPNVTLVEPSASGKLPCSVIMDIKEIPQEHIETGKTYIFFSHTYKGQVENMDTLRVFLKNGCTLVDYEMLVREVTDQVFEEGFDEYWSSKLDEKTREERAKEKESIRKKCPRRRSSPAPYISVGTPGA